MAGAGYKLFNTGDVLLASEVNTYLMQQTVMVFANATARTSALSGVLAEGMLSYLADTNATEVYDGSAWVSVSGTGDITAVTTGANSGLAGGVTTGNADIKINFASKGQLAVGTGSGTTDFLNVGTNGHTLVADSGETTGLKWAAPSAGGLTLISETAASGVTSIDFTSISGSYKQLLLIWSGIFHSTTGSNFGIRLNADSGTNYRHNFLYSVGSSSGAASVSQNGILDSTNNTDYAPFGYSTTSANTYESSAGSLLIDNYASSTKLKTYVGGWTNYDNDGSVLRIVPIISGFYNSTTAITQVNIFRGGGSATLSNRTNTTIRLYGVS